MAIVLIITVVVGAVKLKKGEENDNKKHQVVVCIMSQCHFTIDVDQAQDTPNDKENKP